MSALVENEITINKSYNPKDCFLARAWQGLEMALQPIVNTQTGAVYGFEALMRGHDNMDCGSIQDVLQQASDLNIADQLYLLLLEKALLKLQEFENAKNLKLFYNLDGRAVESNCYLHEETYKLLLKYDISPDALCLEFSETYNYTCATEIAEMVVNHRKLGINFAIDDFGRGISELQLLYEYRPEFIKIDRFFVSGMVTDSRKRLFVSTIINLSHVLGIKVVIEGVETLEEYELGWELGGDLTQGYFVAPPSKKMENFKRKLPHLDKIMSIRKNRAKCTVQMVQERIEKINFLPENSSLDVIFEAFRHSKDQAVFPIVSSNGEPKGIIREKDLKEYTYSPYGRELLKNKNYHYDIYRFVKKCPVLDISATTEKILSVFTYDMETSGILITRNEKYYGFLSSQSLLNIMNDKRLDMAIDQNPLSKLPGNISITKYTDDCLERITEDRYLCYMDFDNFKPFNDHYSFRDGDRAIMMFADLLREHFTDNNLMMGHIGGDDFFASFENISKEELILSMKSLREKFSKSAESLYSYQDRRLGFIEAPDRFGDIRKFPLLSVSIGILRLPVNVAVENSDVIIQDISRIKSKAKRSNNGIFFHQYDDVRERTIGM